LPTYNHKIFKLLNSLSIISEDDIELFAPCVRDNEDIPVLRCKTSGVIFLGNIDQAELSYYRDKEVQTGLFTYEDKEMPFVELDNAHHKAKVFGHLIKNRRWLDFGCGTGVILEKLGPQTTDAWGVEPNKLHRSKAAAKNINMVSSLKELPDKKFDIISLFHVFEHLPDPIELAKELKQHLRPGGTLLVEVPHARDFLLEHMDCAEFRKFTVWSEHLILHTKESLTKFLNCAGFDDVDVFGHQRFPLSNHLYWLRYGQPGGHDKWAFLDSPELTEQYSATLNRIDQTDTIVAIARLNN
jgi:SAM-dependent methyltransferase